MRRIVLQQLAQKARGTAKLQLSTQPVVTRPLFRVGSRIVFERTSCRKFATSTKEAKEELRESVNDLMKKPLGSINWEDAELVLRKCTRDDQAMDLSFQLFDRLAKEESQNSFGDNDRNFHPLNWVVFNWKNKFMQNPHQSPLPSHILGKINQWKEASFLKPDTKTYAMILEAAASYKENHSDGVLFADNLLSRLLELCKTQFSVRPTTLCFAAVMNGWVLSERKEAAEKVDAWMKELVELHEEGWPDMQPNTVVCNILLNAWVRAGEVSKAEELLKTMLESAEPAHPDLISFTTLLNAYAKEQTPEGVSRAETLLGQMHELFEAGYEIAKPNFVSYATVIDSHARLGLGEKAETLLYKLEDLYKNTQDPEWKPDQALYSTVIMAWVRAKQAHRADKVLKKMYEEGIVEPNERCFNAVLSAWAKAGDPDKAEAILTRMQELYSNGELDSKPTVVTYNIVLDCWAKSKRKDACKRSEAILNHMEKLCAAGNEEVKPNATTWNTVLNCFAKARQIQGAEKLLARFTKASRENRSDGGPNVRTWNTLLSACRETRDLRKANSFWRAMKKSGVQPDIVSYNTILTCYARASKYIYPTRDINRIFGQLQEEKDLSPNRITYLALLNASIEAGQPRETEKILKEICVNSSNEASAVQPDRDMFHRALVAWSRNGSPLRAEALLQTMVELHDRHRFDLKPTVETFNRLLDAWAKSEETDSGERAEQILRRMQELAVGGDDEVAPDVVSYNTVINAWANSLDPTALTRIEHLIMEMILKGNPKLTPTEASYGTWLKAISSSKEDDKGRRAQEVLKTMKIHKLEPTDSIQKSVERLTGKLEASF